MVDFDDVSVYPHARRRRRKKKGEKKTHPKIRTNFERSVNELSTQGECEVQIYVGYNTRPSHQFVEHFEVLPFVGLAYQGNDIDYV